MPTETYGRATDSVALNAETYIRATDSVTLRAKTYRMRKRLSTLSQTKSR